MNGVLGASSVGIPCEFEMACGWLVLVNADSL